MKTSLKRYAAAIAILSVISLPLTAAELTGQDDALPELTQYIQQDLRQQLQDQLVVLKQSTKQQLQQQVKQLLQQSIQLVLPERN